MKKMKFENNLLVLAITFVFSLFSIFVLKTDFSSVVYVTLFTFLTISTIAMAGSILITRKQFNKLKEIIFTSDDNFEIDIDGVVKKFSFDNFVDVKRVIQLEKAKGLSKEDIFNQLAGEKIFLKRFESNLDLKDYTLQRHYEEVDGKIVNFIEAMHRSGRQKYKMYKLKDGYSLMSLSGTVSGMFTIDSFDINPDNISLMYFDRGIKAREFKNMLQCAIEFEKYFVE